MIRNLDAPWHIYRLPDVGKMVSQNWQSLVIQVHPDRTGEAAFEVVLEALTRQGFRAITAPLPQYGVHACLLQKGIDDRISLSIEEGARGEVQLLLSQSYPPDVPEEWQALGFPLPDWEVLGGDDETLTLSGAAPTVDAMAVAVAAARRAGFEPAEPPAVDEVGGAGTAIGTDGRLQIGVVRTGGVTLMTLRREMP